MRLHEGLPFAPDADTGANTGPDPDPLQVGEPLGPEVFEPTITADE